MQIGDFGCSYETMIDVYLIEDHGEDRERFLEKKEPRSCGR